ncbi:MAG: shikimate kinase, partial [Candidatus Zixiibacteriota bacterium]
MPLLKHIFLIGFSGSGKSSVGPKLAHRLGLRFVDTDAQIEQRHRKSIERIFADEGKAAFRRYESEAIAELAGRKNRPLVIALGGGAFERKKNLTLVKQHGIV